MSEVRCFKDDAVCIHYEQGGQTIYRCTLCGAIYLGVAPEGGFSEVFEEEIRDKLRLIKRGARGSSGRRRRRKPQGRRTLIDGGGVAL